MTHDTTETLAPPAWTGPVIARLRSLCHRGLIDWFGESAAVALLLRLELDPLDEPSITVAGPSCVTLTWESRTHVVVATPLWYDARAFGGSEQTLCAGIGWRRHRQAWAVQEYTQQPIEPLRNMLGHAYRSTVGERTRQEWGGSD